MTWTKVSTETHPILKLFEYNLRAQRLALIDKLRTLNSMIAIHAPKLRKHPESMQAFIKAQKHLNDFANEVKNSFQSPKGTNHGK